MSATGSTWGNGELIAVLMMHALPLVPTRQSFFHFISIDKNRARNGIGDHSLIPHYNILIERHLFLRGGQREYWIDPHPYFCYCSPEKMTDFPGKTRKL